MVSKYLLDTNILIRFLTNDSEKQATAVENLFQKAPDKSLVVPDVILVETVFVLLSFYDLSKEAIIEKISAMIAYSKFDLHKALFQKTLALYSKYPISFVDAYLGAVSSSKPTRPVFTFDKKMLGLTEIKA